MDTILEFKNLQRSLGNRQSLIRESATVGAGQILAVQGPSGSGKSTLLRVLARLIPFDAGEVWLKGTDWRSIPPEAWRRRVHYVSQKPVMFAGSVEDNLRLPFALKSVQGGTQYSHQAAEQYMQFLDMPRDIWNQNALTVSGGEAARVALIRALMIEPEVLLLDEPTAYLDGENRIKVVQLIVRWVNEKNGRAVVMVSHDEKDLLNINGVVSLAIGQGQGEVNHG